MTPNTDIQKLVAELNLQHFTDGARAVEYLQFVGVEDLVKSKYDDKYELNYDFDDAMRPDKFMLADPRDLARLHFLTLQRKSIQILEFGSGVSTLVFAHALKILKDLYFEEARKIFRQEDLFVVYSVEEDEKWLKQTMSHLPDDLKGFCRLHHSNVSLISRNGLFCTVYDQIPNICPTLIYLDGPSQYATSESIRGFSISSNDRMPMSADLLSIEHFLLPGTMIIVDGRTANARFLKCNFQRSWQYHHCQIADIHLFEMVEEPLGSLNHKQIHFMLGKSFLAAKPRE